MTATVREDILAPATEPEDVAEMAQLIQILSSDAAVEVAASTGERAMIPAALRHVLLEAVSTLVHGDSIKLVPLRRELSTFQAASILGVSRPHLIKLLDQGAIPYRRVGTHRRINLSDLLAYKEQRHTRSQELLTEMTRIAEESGTYD